MLKISRSNNFFFLKNKIKKYLFWDVAGVIASPWSEFGEDFPNVNFLVISNI
jgi:hypothetical protein